MKKWFINQLEKYGFDCSNLKTEVELKGRFLEPGESQKIILPVEFAEQGECRIKKWYFEKGQLVKPGDILGTVENEKYTFEFESFDGGKINYFKSAGQKVEGNAIFAEIMGAKSIFKS